MTWVSSAAAMGSAFEGARLGEFQRETRDHHTLRSACRGQAPPPIPRRRSQTHKRNDEDGVPLTVEGGGSGESPC